MSLFNSFLFSMHADPRCHRSDSLIKIRLKKEHLQLRKERIINNNLKYLTN